VTGVKLKYRLFAVCLILGIASLSLVGNVQAQTITPGVSAGNVFDYHISSYWSTSDSYESIPQNLQEVNQTSHVEIRISDVNTTNVATFSAYYYYNDTYVAGRGNVNLLDGTTYGDFVAIIGANLNKGDLIHPDGSDGLEVLDTSNRNYESGTRETNHVQIVDNNETAGYVTTIDWYFDKSTGMLVEMIERTEATNPTTVYQVTWEIDSALNVDDWVVPEFPVTAMAPILLFAATFAAVVYKKKFIKSSNPTI
jgi:hypothetical protein